MRFVIDCVHVYLVCIFDIMTPSSSVIPVETKKSVAIVLIGNFLDFFDLLLASHLTIILTKVFLPTESAIKPLLITFTFCSAFCIRPLAAFFWGYIGDTIGRVPVLISTTFLMSITCILIPNIPPYAEWGIMSAVLFLLLRLVQGFASGGECIAADVFITETVPKPKVYFYSALVEATCSFGGLVACGIGALCLYLSPEEGWKLPFYIGSGVAVLGTIARRALKETPEFLKAIHNRERRRTAPKIYQSINYRNRNIPALFALYVFTAVAFYFSWAYVPSVMVTKFGMSPNAAMTHTTIVLFVTMCVEILYGVLGVHIHPFKILKFKLIGLLCVLPIFAFIFNGLFHYWGLTIMQLVVICLGQGLTPATPIINKSFPVVGRYTNLLFIWACSHSLMYLVTGYVCDQITSFPVLCMAVFVAALISLVGLVMFRPDGYVKEHAGVDSDDVTNQHADEAQDSIENRKLVRKWINKQLDTFDIYKTPK